MRRLTIFQRTAQWMFPNLDYHAAVGTGMRWAAASPVLRALVPVPGVLARLRDTGLAAAKVDPQWPDQQTSVSEANDLPG